MRNHRRADCDIASAYCFFQLKAPCVIRYSQCRLINDRRCFSKYPPGFMGNVPNSCALVRELQRLMFRSVFRGCLLGSAQPQHHELSSRSYYSRTEKISQFQVSPWSWRRASVLIYRCDPGAFIFAISSVTSKFRVHDLWPFYRHTLQPLGSTSHLLFSLDVYQFHRSFPSPPIYCLNPRASAGSQ